MKKILALILALCLLVPMASALAEDSEFTTDWYTVKLPEGNWERVDGDAGITYFYNNGNVLDGAVMFVIQDMDEATAATMTDEMLPILYNSMISALATYAVDGKVDQEDSEIAGHKGMIFSYVQENNGVKIPVIGNVVFIDGHLIALCYMHMTKTEEEVREVLMELSSNVTYLGK